MKLIGLIRVNKTRTVINPYLLPGGEMLEFKMTAKGKAQVNSATPSCVFCQRLSTFELNGHYVCDNCRRQISRLKEDK